MTNKISHTPRAIRDTARAKPPLGRVGVEERHRARVVAHSRGLQGHASVGASVSTVVTLARTRTRRRRPPFGDRRGHPARARLALAARVGGRAVGLVVARRLDRHGARILVARERRGACAAHPEHARLHQEARRVAPAPVRRVRGARALLPLRPGVRLAPVVRVPREHHRVPRLRRRRPRARRRGVARGALRSPQRRATRRHPRRAPGPRRDPRRAQAGVRSGLPEVRATPHPRGSRRAEHPAPLHRLRARLPRQSHQRSLRARVVVPGLGFRPRGGAGRGPRPHLQRQISQMGTRAPRTRRARHPSHAGDGRPEGARGAPRRNSRRTSPSDRSAAAQPDGPGGGRRRRRGRRRGSGRGAGGGG